MKLEHVLYTAAIALVVVIGYDKFYASKAKG
jgi:hypothetical protein